MDECKCKYKGHTERIGLYIMVFCILLNTCDINIKPSTTINNKSTISEPINNKPMQ